MKYIAWVDRKRYEVEVELQNGKHLVKLDGKKYEVDARRLPDSSVYSMLIAGESYEADVRRNGEWFDVSVRGESYRVSVKEELWATTAGTAVRTSQSGIHQLRAPMPGLVVEIRTRVGEKVKEGQALMVIEAMKMQNELYAQADGTVKEIRVKEQDAVDPTHVLLVIVS
jgi:biotin carboxyl carrier protein